MGSGKRILSDFKVFSRGYLRNRFGLFFGLIFPVILILIFGAIFSKLAPARSMFMFRIRTLDRLLHHK